MIRCPASCSNDSRGRAGRRTACAAARGVCGRGEPRVVAVRPDPDTYAYGNSASDLPHLKLVRRGMLVNGSLAARREAAELEVACVDWT